MLEKNLDINSITKISNGESSISFEINDEIIKITFMQYKNHISLKEYVSHSESILQPNFELVNDNVKWYRSSAKFIILKKLNLKGITNNDILSLYVKLRNDGYLWYDTKIENVGKDENGNILLLDYGELIYINDLDEYNKSLQLEYHRNKKRELYDYYLNIEEQLLKLKKIQETNKKNNVK